MTQAAILAASGSPGTTTGFKNRIINGNMAIDQRNAGSAVTVTGTNWSVDRWAAFGSVTSKYTIQQVALGGGLASFPYAMKVVSSSAYTVGASENFRVQQPIEANNTSDLNFGTANAKSVTVSFWVYSSLTGTFGGALVNENADRSYPFTYTISAATTWEYKTVTIAGDTTGTWAASGNGIGIRVYFNLGAGASVSGTPNTWQSGFYTAPTGAVSVVGTNAATWYISGIQLEVGTTATNFDFRSYGTELQLCQRYYEKSYDQGTALGTATENGIFYSSGRLGSSTTGEIDCGLRFKVEKRAAPTLAFWDSAGNTNKGNRLDVGVLNSSNQAISALVIGSSGCLAQSTGTANAGIIEFHYSASAEL